MDQKLNKYNEELQMLKESGNFRALKNISANGYKVNLSSNDYLGVSKKNIPRPKGNSFGSGSSRLLTGNFKEYVLLENELEKLYGRPALFFNSGYHANIGILAALAEKDDLIISDKLNHASIIDGIRLSSAEQVRFKHADYDHLTHILDTKRKDYNRVFIVSESVFSMDGDEADLEKLIEIKKRFDCFLYIDEAHTLGVRGTKGLGLSEEKSCLDDIDLLVGTFGKAMNSVGAFVVCDSILKEYLINKMRSLIFTTALPPIVISWNYIMLRTIVKMKMEREHLHFISNQLRDGLKDAGIATMGSSNIIPVLVGDSQKCINLAEYLQKKGFLVFAIRPPAVPKDSARLRISVCADMDWEDIKDLPELIKNYCNEN
ncbi:aminotransferase class I/II-fold pyridoxal phosphate-dependent enzyme [Labilibaculum antarcticum]|uniref:8-amino-7-oxononanoate synthase n=1 Tax=Labilibaculum antarcticum TaxID=1717717 RepID=A0A1Y1CPE3_9BACT|nr:8-amino-7-oxononanoate synthase [Labilibaculum antarcticum]BAX82297.1 8-amino-7-oxononanoate synthase [Labilibaculum antarcticum]